MHSSNLGTNFLLHSLLEDLYLCYHLHQNGCEIRRLYVLHLSYWDKIFGVVNTLINKGTVQPACSVTETFLVRRKWDYF